MTSEPAPRFPDGQADKLLAVLLARPVLPGRDHEAIVHALTDIAASVEKPMENCSRSY